MFLISCRLWALRRFGAVLIALGAAGIAAAQEPSAPTIPREWRALWEEDLHFAKRAAEEKHPDIFHTLSRAEWNREFDTLVERLDSLQHHEIVVELARIVARLQDGHTRLTLPLGPGIDFMQGHSETAEPHLPELRFHQYPVRFAIDAQGVYVQRIAAQHRALLGARVVRLGRLDAAEALRAVSPTIRRDNELQIRHHMPQHLVLAEVLHACGVTASRTHLRIEARTPEGKLHRVDLGRVPHGSPVDWADTRDGANAVLPLYLQRPERKFWFSHLADRRTVYLQFNEVYDEEDEALRDFATRVGSFIVDHGVENLIVDLRNNRGGNQRLARPLLHAILCSPANRTGHLFALIGRTTFSAAMTFALSLEKHTRVLFVGEPTGSSPNHFGDSRKQRLPNTGLTLRVSTLYWQYHPTDARTALAPHIPVDLTADDYRANRDPGVDTVLEIVSARAGQQAGGSSAAQSTGSDLAGTPGALGILGSWSGLTSPGANSFELGLSIRGAASAPRIQLRIPALGIDSEATDASFQDGSGRFGIRWREEPMLFTGSVAGDWFIGEGDFRSVYFPFVLRRQPPGETPLGPDLRP